MTTIAYRDGVLVSDSQVTLGGMKLPGNAVKIGKTKTGILYGGAGSWASLGQFFDWVNSPEDGELPEGEYSGIIVLPKGEVMEVENGSFLPKVKQKFFSIGSGAPFALAAMMAGATAQQAVKIATKLDIHSGGSIKTIKL
jgi:ATP-dependent protease HslVU (ClpYQ) peptidase subunit